MGEVNHGLRSILSTPYFYSLFQSLMGAHKFRKKFTRTKIKPFEGMKVLDVGCGPADIISYLPNVEYWGFDISSDYIRSAQKKFGSCGNFFCKQFQLKDLVELPSFDVVLAIGLLHHLGDSEVVDLLNLFSQALKSGGKLLTVDPCFDPGQNPIARFLVVNDRGQNVRDRIGYSRLASQVFNSVLIEVKHQAWIPYTHCFMECYK